MTTLEYLKGVLGFVIVKARHFLQNCVKPLDGDM